MDEFVALQGATETPQAFHRWAALSLLAAAVRDTMGMYREARRKTIPNLYVFLVGPPGCGKGPAVDTAVELAHDAGLDVYPGELTGQFLIRYLAGRSKRQPRRDKRLPDPRVYLCFEELGQSVPDGEYASRLMKTLTALWVSKRVPYKKGTKHDDIEEVPPGYVINLLAGSTESWLLDAFPKGAMESGFGARVLLIYGERDRSTLRPEIAYPPDYQERRATLLERLAAYTTLEEQSLHHTPDTRAWHTDWYHQHYKQLPEDERLIGHWDKADELLAKFMTLAALNRWDPRDGSPAPTAITVDDCDQALAWWREAQAHVPLALKASASSQEAQQLERAARLIQRAMPHGIHYRVLQQRLAGLGILTEAYHRILYQLQEQNCIEGTEPPRITRRWGALPQGTIRWKEDDHDS